jgi:DNA repair protein RadA
LTQVDSRDDKISDIGLESESEFVTALNRAGFSSVKRLAATGPREISRLMGIDLEKATSIHDWAHSKLEDELALHRPYDIAEIFYEKRKIKHKISTGSLALNRLLRGGVETGALTEFHGPSGCGKTQLCFTLSTIVQQPPSQGGLNGKIVYIDTEGKFRPERIKEIAIARGLNASNVLQNIRLARPLDSSEQEKNIDGLPVLLEKVKNVELIIIDSIISHYRTEFGGRESLPGRQHRLYKSMRQLGQISEIYDVAVVITNQVQSSPDYFTLDKTVPSGGNLMAHASTYRIQFKCNASSYGSAAMVTSPYHAPSSERFMINEKGICDYGD